MDKDEFSPLYRLGAQELKEIFKVTEDGEIEVDGICITDDDAKVADCLRAWAKAKHNVHIRAANR